MIDSLYLAVLVISSIIDVKKGLVHNFTYLVLIILFIADIDITLLMVRIASAFIIVIPILLLTINKDFIGGGDIKFIFCNALINGFTKSINAVIIGCLLMTAYYFIKSKIKKDTSNFTKPMLPFLSVGFFIFRRI